MKELRLEYPLEVMSKLFDVSRSGYYRWLRRKPTKRELEEPRMVAEVKAAHKRNRESYGAERLQSDLADRGVKIGVHRIKRIKKDHGIRCKMRRKYKATTNSKHNLPVAANLLDQNFTANSPNKVWLTDITYKYKGGKL